MNSRPSRMRVIIDESILQVDHIEATPGFTSKNLWVALESSWTNFGDLSLWLHRFGYIERGVPIAIWMDNFEFQAHQSLNILEPGDILTVAKHGVSPWFGNRPQTLSVMTAKAADPATMPAGVGGSDGDGNASKVSPELPAASLTGTVASKKRRPSGAERRRRKLAALPEAKRQKSSPEGPAPARPALQLEQGPFKESTSPSLSLPKSSSSSSSSSSSEDESSSEDDESPAKVAVPPPKEASRTNSKVAMQEKDTLSAAAPDPQWKKPYEVIAQIGGNFTAVEADERMITTKFPAAPVPYKPKVGDSIAYQELDFCEETLTPKLSAFHYGRVKSVNSDVVTLETTENLLSLTEGLSRGKTNQALWEAADISIMNLANVHFVARPTARATAASFKGAGESAPSAAAANYQAGQSIAVPGAFGGAGPKAGDVIHFFEPGFVPRGNGTQMGKIAFKYGRVMSDSGASGKVSVEVADSAEALSQVPAGRRQKKKQKQGRVFEIALADLACARLIAGPSHGEAAGGAPSPHFGNSTDDFFELLKQKRSDLGVH